MSLFSTTAISDSNGAAAAAATTLESTPSGAINGEGGNKTPHYHFIHSMILPSTVKIQKELKGRKFKVRFVAFICLCVLCICGFCVCVCYCCVLGPGSCCPQEVIL
jgi:hypothetical protein